MTSDQFTNWLAIEGWHYVRASEDSLHWSGIQNDTTKKCWLLLSDGRAVKGSYVPTARVVEASIMPQWHAGIIERITEHNL